MNNVKKFKENGYLIIPNILSKELLDFIGVYAFNSIRVCETAGINVWQDTEFPDTPALYCDGVMENLSDFLLPKLELLTGLKLLSTYTYFRLYKAGDILGKHTDREACEISATLSLRKKGNIWPIYANNTDYKTRERDKVEFTPPDKFLDDSTMSAREYTKEILTRMHKEQIEDTTSILLDEGGALIYRGCEIVHWREAYNEGTKLAQVFLHYVDANGKFTEWKNDKVHDKYFAQDK